MLLTHVQSTRLFLACKNDIYGYRVRRRNGFNRFGLFELIGKCDTDWVRNLEES